MSNRYTVIVKRLGGKTDSTEFTGPRAAYSFARRQYKEADVRHISIFRDNELRREWDKPFTGKK